MRQGIVVQHLQPHAGDALQVGLSDNRVRVLVGPLAAGQNRTVRLRCEGRPCRRFALSRFQNPPQSGGRRYCFFPQRNFSLDAGIEEQCIDRLTALRELRLALGQPAALAGHLRVDVVGAIAFIGARENRLQAVVLVLRNRVELVVVAASAVDRRADKRGHHGGDDVIAVQVAADLAVERVFADVAQRAFVPRPGSEETGGHGCPRIVRKEHVAGHLLLDKTAVGHVLVEGPNQVIAIRPGVVARPVLVMAVRLSEVDDVHPVPGPALAVLRTGQQALHDLLIGVRRVVGQEGVNGVWWGRHADQVEVHPA